MWGGIHVNIQSSLPIHVCMHVETRGGYHMSLTLAPHQIRPPPIDWLALWPTFLYHLSARVTDACSQVQIFLYRESEPPTFVTGNFQAEPSS